MTIKELLNVERVYNLVPNDSHKSFYGKAKVTVLKDGTMILKSYETDVARIEKDGTVTRLWSGWSATTGRHIRAFCGMDKKEFTALPVTIRPEDKTAAYSGTLYR